MGTENWFSIGCSDKFVGTTVPTNIVGTPNGGFLLAVPTNLSEQTSIYYSASGNLGTGSQALRLFCDFCALKFNNKPKILLNLNGF